MAQCLSFLIRLGCRFPAGNMVRLSWRSLAATAQLPRCTRARQVSSSSLKMTIDQSSHENRGDVSQCGIRRDSDMPLSAAAGETHSLPCLNDAELAVLNVCPDYESVLQYVAETAKEKQLSPQQTAYIIEKLYHSVYSHLSACTPWLQSNEAIAYIQLTINEDLQPIMEPIQKHPGFQVLLDKINRHMTNFSPEDLTQSFLMLLRMGLDPTSELSHKLLFHCREHCMDFSLAAFSNYLEACRILHKTDTLMWRKAAEKHKQILLTINPSEDAAYLHAKITLNLLKILSDEMKQDSLKVLLALIEGNPQDTDPLHLGTYLRVAHKITMQNQTWDNEHVRQQIAKIVISVLRHPGVVESLSTYSIAEITNHLKICMQYPLDLRHRMQDRALELLDEDPRISDLSNIMCAFTSQDMSIYVKRRLEDLLYKNLRDADVFVLSNLTTVLRDVNCHNRDVLELFHDQIIRHTDSIMDHWTRFQKITAHLRWNHFYNKKQQEKFQEALLKSLDQQFGINTRTLAMVAGYALPSVKNSIPEKLYQKIIDFLPQISMNEIYHLMHGLQKIECAKGGELEKQVDTISSGVHDSVMHKLDSVNSLDCLYRLILVLVVHRKTPDPVLVDTLMHLLPKFTRDMTPAWIGKVSKMLSNLQYCQEDVMEDIATNILANEDDMDISHMTTAVNCFATAGYWPKAWDRVAQIGMEIYNRQRNRVGVRHKVQFGYYMARMQYFSEDLLSEIFSLDFIEDVDSHFESVGAEKRAVLEATLCVLNRIVVLECPQMDVPWFHQQFALARLEKRRKETAFQQEVKGVLKEALGGAQYFHSKTVTPYCYEIDFQCILDKQLSPVSLAGAPLKEFTLPPGHQRLAILTLPECCFCMNTRQPTGYTLMKNRHLELLGYHVIWVPHFEWNSMALTEKKAKIDYIKDLIHK